jgi:hypothetical protein
MHLIHDGGRRIIERKVSTQPEATVPEATVPEAATEVVIAAATTIVTEPLAQSLNIESTIVVDPTAPSPVQLPPNQRSEPDGT